MGRLINRWTGREIDYQVYRKLYNWKLNESGNRLRNRERESVDG